MRFSWIMFLGWLLAAVFIFLYVKSCQPGHALSPAKGDSIAAEAARIHQADSIRANGYLEMMAYWRNKYDSMQNSYQQIKQRVLASAEKIKNLIDSNKYYKMALDTAHQLTTCDDLITQDSILLELLTQASVKIDSLNSFHNKQMVACDSTILILKSDNTQLSFALSDLHHEYDQAVAEANKAIKKAKASSLWTKITAAALVIVGVTAYLTHK